MKKQKYLSARPRNRFLKVVCGDCGNEQVIFSAASTKINCFVCNKELAKTGPCGIKVKTRVIEVFE